MTKQLLYKKYPWLKTSTTVEEYIKPDYYNALLKSYVFDGLTDLEHFENFIKSSGEPDNLNILELGCGTGRATQILLDNVKLSNSRLTLVDLSKRMIAWMKNKLSDSNVDYVESDIVDYLHSARDTYDIVFSLWSFSHSTHQILTKQGIKQGSKYIQEALEKLIKINMKSGSRSFLIHFDSLSDEQKILIEQWKKVYPIFGDTKTQSPSKLLIDRILKKLESEQTITLKIKHYIGKPIEYSSLDEALEIFLNFHMESYFNTSSLLEGVVSELTAYFQKFKDKNGAIKIKPGCFIYEITKN